jgi:hypothetical protein
MTKSKPLPPLAFVEKRIDYNAETGEVFWKQLQPQYWKQDEPDQVLKAGWYCKSTGYFKLQFFKKIYLVHRIIWLLYYKKDPQGMQVDHIDRVRTNNKIANLRLVTGNENMHNRTLNTNNTSGYNGVHYCKTKCKYYVNITVLGKQKHIGLFTTLEDAILAREKAEIKYWL